MHWLGLYIFANIFCACVMSATGELVGDAQGSPLYSQAALLWATLLVVGSYVIILGPVFNFCFRLRIRPLTSGLNDHRVPEVIGAVLIALQVAFMAFNIIEGVNVAGANTVRSESPLAMIWVFIPVDAIFFVYYGLYRESKYFYLNLAIWLASNVMRGWSGIFMFVLFFEWCRAVRNNKVSVTKAIILGVAVVVFLPVLTALKWVFRSQVAEAISIDTVISGLLENLQVSDYFTILYQGLAQVLGRLQVTSVMVEVIRLSDLLQSEFAKGAFTPFWLEGLHGILYERLFVGDKSIPISVTFTQYADFGFQSAALGDWNVNTGILSWFFIAPALAPLYLIYIFCLGMLSVYLVRKIGANPSAKDMVWLAWLVYLMPPWFPAFITFIQALVIMLAMRVILPKLMRRS